jgi:hypothetical protein
MENVEFVAEEAIEESKKEEDTKRDTKSKSSAEKAGLNFSQPKFEQLYNDARHRNYRKDHIYVP